MAQMKVQATTSFTGLKQQGNSYKKQQGQFFVGSVDNAIGRGALEFKFTLPDKAKVTSIELDLLSVINFSDTNFDGNCTVYISPATYTNESVVFWDNLSAGTIKFNMNFNVMGVGLTSYNSHLKTGVEIAASGKYPLILGIVHQKTDKCCRFDNTKCIL